MSTYITAVLVILSVVVCATCADIDPVIQKATATIPTIQTIVEYDVEYVDYNSGNSDSIMNTMSDGSDVLSDDDDLLENYNKEEAPLGPIDEQQAAIDNTLNSLEYPPSKELITFTMTLPMPPGDSINTQWGVFLDAIVAKFKVENSNVRIISVAESAMWQILTHTLQVVATVETSRDKAILVLETVSHDEIDLVLMGVNTTVGVSDVSLSQAPLR